jgi:hypothetical protein
MYRQQAGRQAGIPLPMPPHPLCCPCAPVLRGQAITGAVLAAAGRMHTAHCARSCPACVHHAAPCPSHTARGDEAAGRGWQTHRHTHTHTPVIELSMVPTRLRQLPGTQAHHMLSGKHIRHHPHYISQRRRNSYGVTTRPPSALLPHCHQSIPTSEVHHTP